MDPQILVILKQLADCMDQQTKLLAQLVAGNRVGSVTVAADGAVLLDGGTLGSEPAVLAPAPVTAATMTASP